MGSFIMELNELAQIKCVVKKLRERLGEIDIPPETLWDIQLVVTEVLGNAFLHGTKGLERPRVIIEWLINSNSIAIKFKDNGPGFDHKSWRDFETSDLLAEEGRGLFLISKVLDELQFNEKGNELFCLKRW